MRCRYVPSSVLLVSALASACASKSPPSAAPPVVAPFPPVVVAAQTPPSEAPPAPAPTPTPEERKKAAQDRELAEARTARSKWEAENKAELARWTPERHAEAKALADKTFPSGKAAIQAAMKGPHRRPGAVDRDKYRHPAETLDFYGFKPTMTVLDIGPGEGWYTDLLAPALAKSGRYIATSADPNGAPDQPATLSAQRFKALIEKAPELYGRVQTLVVDPKAPALGPDGSVDLALILRGVHGMKNNGTLDRWLAEIHRVLKPGGVLGIEEHRALPDADPAVSAKKGYVPEPFVIHEVEAAGFKLAGKSEINANPKDTKDYPQGVWSLPPTLRPDEKGHENDREKYLAIGESDRMTLKFVKVAPK